ncbi:Aste57867_9538 [Aphanomyces stellatus]|uniref:Aste57867_9538 protein n=1 Tax=Aphanomyces stellatus TaxID=120398 RepID=A0A485KNI6_9STRA|nr:hypothetical protein As57867_009501 [Aphanomyces stellatus]VFT86417.1 Aste57867_9538 [Aphanomyces stellatus]
MNNLSRDNTASGIGERRRGLSVRISHADCSPVQQTQYVVRVRDFQTDSYERTVRRPYSEFRRLRTDLLETLKECADDSLSMKAYKQIQVVSFPPKRLFGSRSESVVRTRAKALNKWITRILAITTEYRKAQKALVDEDPSASTLGSAMLLDTLKDFFMSRVEELNLIQLDKAHSLPIATSSSMPPEIRVALRTVSSSFHDHSDNRDDVHMDGRPPKPSAHKSILKSSDRAKLSPTSSRRNKTRFSLAEPPSFEAYAAANLSSNTSSSSEETHQRTSSSSTAPSSFAGSFAGNRPVRIKSSAQSVSFHKAPAQRSVRATSIVQHHRASLTRDARYSLTHPKVVKRLPAGDDAAIVLQAETELQNLGLVPETAQMILRYMDRFLVKATQRQPGCYRITPDNWLAIDAERLCSELEDALFDPDSMQHVLFHDGEWRIPPALEGYIQHKWAVHHNTAMDEMDDDSDQEEELVEVNTRSMRKTAPRFSRHDIDEIEMLMSSGTASRSQVKQLRRQLDEGGWDRRGKLLANDSDDDGESAVGRVVPTTKCDGDRDSLGEEEEIDFATYAYRKSQMRKDQRRTSSAYLDSGGLV